MSRHRNIRGMDADDYDDGYYDEYDDGDGEDYGAHSPSNDSYIYQRPTSNTTTVKSAVTTTIKTVTKPTTTSTTSKPTPASTYTTSNPASTTTSTKPTPTTKPAATSTSTSKPTTTSTSKSTTTSQPTSTSTSQLSKSTATSSTLTQDDAYAHDYLDGEGYYDEHGEYGDYGDYGDGYDEGEYWEDEYDPPATLSKSTPNKSTPATKKTSTTTTSTSKTTSATKTPSKTTSTTTTTSTSTSATKVILTPVDTPSRPLRSAAQEQETQAAIEAIRLAKLNIETPSTPQHATATSSPTRFAASHELFDTPAPSHPSSTTTSALSTPRGLPHSSTSNELSSHLPLGPVITRSASALGQKDVTTAATTAKLQREKESLLESESRRDVKPLLNMVVIGHVDAGKSTLMGHLLFLQGRISSKQMHKYEKESKEMGKASFAFAWVLDEQEDERSRGVTVDVAMNYFETPSKRITLLDAPGHKDFIPNMISGAAQADAAVLVIPAVVGEFESGFMDDGQTKEHAILARSLGVAQLIVAVNKLDSVDWSQQRYHEIQLILLPFLKSAGFKEKDVTFVPVSGLTGVNILSNKEPLLQSWYTGPTLLQLIDQFQLPQRHVDKPFRLCIVDVFRSQTLGITVCGKLESGCLIPRDRVLIQPLNELAIIKAIESRGEILNIAKAGDNVEIGLREVTNETALLPGQFLCDPSHPIPLVTHFRGQIITMAYKVPLLEGTQVILFTQSTQEPATITRLNAILDKTKGDITKKNPRAIPRSSSAIIEITVKRPICVELFRSYRELGRFTLRRGGDTVGVGIITKLFREM